MRKTTILAMLLVCTASVFAQQPPQNAVGPQKYGDGTPNPARRLDGTGAGVVVEGNGKYFEPTQRGQMFVYSTAQAGVLLAAPTTTFFGPAIWNPCGSSRDLAIIKVAVGDVSGTTVRGHIAYAIAKSIGAQVGTGSPVPTATLVTPQNAYIGSGNTSAMNFAPAAITWTTAPTYLAPMGMNVIATAPGTGYFVDYVDGAIVVAPCNAFIVGANAGVTLTATVSIWGIEAPQQGRAIQ